MPVPAWPSLTRVTVSTAIVENVVNTPRKPTAISGRTQRADQRRSCTTVRKQPSTNAPARLVTNVARGNVPGATGTTRLTPYRASAPAAPPTTMHTSTPGCTRTSATSAASTSSTGSSDTGGHRRAQAAGRGGGRVLRGEHGAPADLEQVRDPRRDASRSTSRCAARVGRAVGVRHADHLGVAVLGAVADRPHRRPRARRVPRTPRRPNRSPCRPRSRPAR